MYPAEICFLLLFFSSLRSTLCHLWRLSPGKAPGRILLLDGVSRIHPFSLVATSFYQILFIHSLISWWLNKERLFSFLVVSSCMERGFDSVLKFQLLDFILGFTELHIRMTVFHSFLSPASRPIWRVLLKCLTADGSRFWSNSRPNCRMPDAKS